MNFFRKFTFFIFAIGFASCSPNFSTGLSYPTENGPASVYYSQGQPYGGYPYGAAGQGYPYGQPNTAFGGQGLPINITKSDMDCGCAFKFEGRVPHPTQFGKWQRAIWYRIAYTNGAVEIYVKLPGSRNVKLAPAIYQMPSPESPWVDSIREWPSRCGNLVRPGCLNP